MNSFTRCLSATLIIFSITTTSIIIADSEVINIVKQGDVEYQAQYLPERSYGTVGFAPLSLKIKNEGSETLVFDHGSIDLQTQSVKEVMKSLNVKSVGSKALKGAGIGAATGIGTGALGLATYIAGFIPFNVIVIGIGAAITYSSVSITPIAILLGAAIGAIKQTAKRKRIRRKIRKLAFEQKQINPGSTEEVVLFVENGDKVHDFKVTFAGSARSIALHA